MKHNISLTPSASRCRHWPFWVVIVALLAVLGLSLLLNLAAVGVLAGGAPRQTDPDGWGEDEFPRFTEVHSYGSGTTKVVRITFAGILTRQLDAGFFGSIDPVEGCLRRIRAARQDDDVAAILLEIDSPGGDVTSADEIHRELTLFKESREDRRIIALVHDMAASGGYYIALPSDRIIAQPTALVGSIGVILQAFNAHGLGEKIGISDASITTGRNKDLLNPLQPVDPEQVALLQEAIDAIHERFMDLVADARPISKTRLKKLADGRIFTADQALEVKLIDAIGYWEEALDETAALLGTEEVFVVAYEDSRGFFDQLFGLETTIPDLHALFHAAATPRRLFLWRP